LRLAPGGNPGDVAAGCFFYFENDSGAFSWFNNGYTNSADYRDSTTGVYLVRSAAAVPEPGSWAMLIAGFGLTGIVARRRHRLAA
jgi:hypothetical protein